MLSQSRVLQRFSISVFLNCFRVSFNYHFSPSALHLSSDQHPQLPHPSGRSGGSTEIAEEREVGRSGQHPGRACPSRGRSHGKYITNSMQQDLADRGMAHTMDPDTGRHPSHERQLTTVPELPHDHPYMPSKQSYVKDLAKQTEASGGDDRC